MFDTLFETLRQREQEWDSDPQCWWREYRLIKLSSYVCILGMVGLILPDFTLISISAALLVVLSFFKAISKLFRLVVDQNRQLSAA